MVHEVNRTFSDEDFNSFAGQPSFQYTTLFKEAATKENNDKK